MYEEGYEYRSVNCYRSAISGFHETISGFRSAISGFHEGLPVGQHPEVCTLLTEVFNLRPPQPRYSSTWDVQIVLEFIKNNWTDNKSLPIKDLTLKLTMLFAPMSVSRASSIHHLDIRFISLSKEKVVFHFTNLLKTWKKGRAPANVKFLHLRKKRIFV